MLPAEISLDNTVHNRNKVKAIKALRAASGLGLKESKEVVDHAQEYGVSRTMVYEQKFEGLVRDLIGTGWRATGKDIEDFEGTYGDLLREVATIATLRGDMILAHEVTNILSFYTKKKEF